MVVPCVPARIGLETRHVALGRHRVRLADLRIGIKVDPRLLVKLVHAGVAQRQVHRLGFGNAGGLAKDLAAGPRTDDRAADCACHAADDCPGSRAQAANEAANQGTEPGADGRTRQGARCRVALPSVVHTLDDECRVVRALDEAWHQIHVNLVRHLVRLSLEPVRNRRVIDALAELGDAVVEIDDTAVAPAGRTGHRRRRTAAIGPQGHGTIGCSFGVHAARRIGLFHARVWAPRLGEEFRLDAGQRVAIDADRAADRFQLDGRALFSRCLKLGIRSADESRCRIKRLRPEQRRLLALANLRTSSCKRFNRVALDRACTAGGPALTARQQIPGGLPRHHPIGHCARRALVAVTWRVEPGGRPLAMALLDHMRRLVCGQPQVGVGTKRDRRAGRKRGSTEPVAGFARTSADVHPHRGQIVPRSERILDALAVRQRPAGALFAVARDIVRRLPGRADPEKPRHSLH
ncbi:MAG: hypothetical protein AW07_03342 [Candidatus Accumulibacter sp. SK-11]|nr:MAG: hypothetical protein AW07_03342 [Candidatus Accumulibacter sp. SK-11]